MTEELTQFAETMNTVMHYLPYVLIGLTAFTLVKITYFKSK